MNFKCSLCVFPLCLFCSLVCLFFVFLASLLSGVDRPSPSSVIMLFSLAIPFSLLIASVNGAALPQKRETDLNARDLLSDLGDIVQGIAQAIPTDVLDPIESLVGSLVDSTDLAALAAPAAPTAVPQIPGSPLGAAAPTPAIPIPGAPLAQPAVVDPENPAGIPLPGTPFTVTAPAAAAAATTAPARRSRLNARDVEMEKRIDLDGIVNAVVSALPSGVAQKLAPIVNDLIPGAAKPTSAGASPATTPSPVNQDAVVTTAPATPTSSPNAARSLSGSSFTLTGSAVVLASMIFGAVVAL
ncbi:hypothetical protein BDW22DRAFT_1349967 [Trametopsis cervina]|nr:hypothetical protein BDW22DRAFT_1349967 [Trametopsis cervina]